MKDDDGKESNLLARSKWNDARSRCTGPIFFSELRLALTRFPAFDLAHGSLRVPSRDGSLSSAPASNIRLTCSQSVSQAIEEIDLVDAAIMSFS